MSDWKKVEPELFKFEKIGDGLEGKLLSVGRGGKFDNKVYKIQQKDGKTVTVFSTAVLESLMDSVSLGQEVQIIFTGEKEGKSGQNKTKLFEVMTR